MELQEGKNIEKLLVGGVKHPLSNRQFQELVFREGHGDAEEGLRTIRKDVKNRIGTLMEQVRLDQIETDPSSHLKRAFANNLLNDVDLEMGELENIEDGRYKLRLFSTSDTLLDYAGSFDCWIEVFDQQVNQPIADYKVDIKTRPNEKSKYLADAVFYFDPKFQNDELKGKIDPRVFQEPGYKYLVKNVALALTNRSKIRQAA
jgi:hypothetical protein